VNLLRAATLTVADPKATAARYGQWLDYAVVEQGRVDPDLAASWGAPASANRDMVVCRPASGADVFLRFVQGDPPTDYRPLRTFGWAALEICVSDTLAVAERMAASPFEVIGPPRELDGMPEIFPMQVRGPDNEIVYLTQIRSQPQGVRLAQAQSLIDRLFILVLASADLTATRAWFGDHLGLTVQDEVAIRYTMISKAFELAPETKHRIATAGHEIDTFLEFDQYPEGATARPCAADQLAPGVAVATLLHPDLDAVTAPFLTPPRPRAGAIYGGQRCAVVRTPEGALVELIEAPASDLRAGF
jgi:catechol 2,3-dioxygenase-like lactoylglutathione lyase family enzyme